MQAFHAKAGVIFNISNDKLQVCQVARFVAQGKQNVVKHNTWWLARPSGRATAAILVIIIIIILIVILIITVAVTQTVFLVIYFCATIQVVMVTIIIDMSETAVQEKAMEILRRGL